MTESKVYLREFQSGNLVVSSLFDEVTAEHLILWNQQWVPAMQAHCAGRILGARPEDSHWDWQKKSQAVSGMLGYFEMTETQADAFCRNH